MRVGIDATSLLGPRSGVGHYTAELIDGLLKADPDVELVLVGLSARRGHRLRTVVGGRPRVSVVRSPIPAGIAKRTWPPIELFSGRVDVFHGPNFALPPMLKGAGVMTVHDIGFLWMPDACSPHTRSFVDLVPLWASRAHRILVPSRFTANELGHWLPHVRDRIQVVPQGVRQSFASSGGPLSIPRRDALGITGPYVAYLGTLESRKNVDVLLQAFSSVVAEHHDAQLVMVGTPGVGWGEISARHGDLLRTRSVVVTGHLPDAEAAAIVRGAEAFAYPSLYEGFGMPPVEAMAAGTPVVASDIPVLRETLGEHADFVDPTDPGALAAMLAGLMSQPASADRRARAREHASRYTWEATAAATLDCYREAMKG